MFLEMKNITKKYGPVLANDNISLSLEKGEVLAIVGENGAGKSTIMKVLYGLEKPTEGEIYINGEKQHFRSPEDSIAKGIGMVQQNFMLFNSFTVAENIVYGNEPREKSFFFNRKKAVKIVEELSKKYGLKIDPTLKVSSCSIGLQQRVEILKVLYQDADIIIFDEPSAVLTPQEVDELLETIKNLSEMGKSIIIITHKLQEVMDVSDRIVILRKGKFIKEVMTKDTNIEELSYLMVGRKLIDEKVPKQDAGEKVLDIRNLRYADDCGIEYLKGLDMHVREGEIVGIAGVSGNGQTELIRCIVGMNKATSGEILLNGVDVVGKSVREIREIGCAHIPEDRYHLGCAKMASLTETGIMGHYRKEKFSKNGILKNKNIDSFALDMLENYDVVYSTPDQKAGELSGGNIQKLIVAREIEQNSKFIIAAEPTRGVDIGAMEFIHGNLLKKRAQGDGVLLISSELTEIMELSDRIYVIYDGKINGEWSRENATSEELGLFMMGGSKNVQ